MIKIERAKATSDGSKFQSEEKKEYLKLFVLAVNPDNVWRTKLHRSKWLSLAEMGTFGKSARPCTILYITLTFILLF